MEMRGTGITSLPDGLTVGGSLDLSGTGITSLPDGLNCNGLYFDPASQLKNHSAYRRNCGKQKRIIYVVFIKHDFMVAAGCFFGSFKAFCGRVETEYDAAGAQAYIAKARECVDELAEKLGMACEN